MTRPIESSPGSANQITLRARHDVGGVALSYPRTGDAGRGTGNCVSCPDVLRRPIVPDCHSASHSAPSGPTAMPFASEEIGSG